MPRRPTIDQWEMESLFDAPVVTGYVEGRLRCLQWCWTARGVVGITYDGGGAHLNLDLGEPLTRSALTLAMSNRL